MTNSAGTFLIELSSVFNPKGFEDANKKIKESNSSFGNYFNALSSKSDDWARGFSANSKNTANLSAEAVGKFFDITSKNFLNLQSLAETIFGNILKSFIATVAEMTAKAALSGIFGLFGGGGGGFLGGLLGSRRTGGPIDDTGPYLLHAGEFVLPPEVVSSIKQSRTPSLSMASATAGQTSGSVNITVNTPLTVNSAAGSNIDAKQLCEQISAAARRGVTWAVEQAKISYKIGRQKSGETSL